MSKEEENQFGLVYDGATHIQTYWKPEYVEQVVNKLKEFYAKYL